MPRILFRLLLAAALLFLPLLAEAEEIKGPDVRINDGHILVTASLELGDKQLTDISKGISKEIDIYVDLFRVWPSWPDEFVLGTRFTRTISCDSVKKEYVATSLSGNTLREKRFSDCGSLLRWALKVESHELTSIAELEPAEYFVRVTAESRLRKIPPVMRYLFFFVKDKEFKIYRDSASFSVNGGEAAGGRAK